MPAWPIPTSSGAIEPLSGKRTAPLPVKLSFVGRSLDSHDTREWQGPVRTFRARKMRDLPEQNSFLQIQGARLSKYIRDRYFQRLAAGEPLDDSPAGRTLRPDFSFMLPEAADPAEHGWTNNPTGAGIWKWDRADGQDRLYDFDVDDRGYVYVALNPYGAGILDSSLNSVHQFRDEGRDRGFGANRIRVFFVASQYYCQISDGATVRAYNVTDPSAPYRLPNLSWDPFPVEDRSGPPGIVYSVPPSVARGAGLVAWFGTESMLGGGNIRLFKDDGTPIPLKVPGTDLEFFASYYSNYAKLGGFTNPSATQIVERQRMGDVAIVKYGDETHLIVAANGLCDDFLLKLDAATKPVASGTAPEITIVATKSLVMFTVPAESTDLVLWRFSDGRGAVGRKAFQQFKVPGTFTAKVTVRHNNVLTIATKEFTIK